MALNYVNQPPMIPHSVEGYQLPLILIVLFAMPWCGKLSHHRGTARVSPTHFYGCNRQVLGEVAPNRYFCLLCHVPQSDTAPIVDNTFTHPKFWEIRWELCQITMISNK
ncbi:nitrate reductase cytochrome c-type subunit [Providencia rettgeri]|uniref:Periplasmic nitrate reductase, electron transfer subunit n=1 Tax=Providencia rettgeri TaxID=587 RepID=A0A939NAZ7_PRORE|nr:nitrate reductase cytochrome c-type subunit [Providencia rettgeri]